MGVTESGNSEEPYKRELPKKKSQSLLTNTCADLQHVQRSFA